MKPLLFVLILLIALALYFQYFYRPSHGPGAPAAVTSSATAPQTQPSTGQQILERATGKTAADQGMKVRRVIDKANRSNVRMPNF